MNRNLKIFFVFVFAIGFFASCSSIEKMVDPFVGNWVSGAFNLEFKNDHTFKLSIGKTISVNLDGEYEYDDSILKLNIEGDSELSFSYEFKDDKNKLVLKPESESSYFNTKIEFDRE
ncbi:MAG: hypothetical protein DHS20C13_21560 [Thermodesulfobacteriota bacterium]|nr:MAG: hypothetical protein DHS20C13_21560 [Thermodesulfobacteriota bacterium]